MNEGPYRDEPKRAMTLEEAKEILHLYRGWNEGQMSMASAASRGIMKTDEDAVYDARRTLIKRATELLTRAAELQLKNLNSCPVCEYFPCAGYAHCPSRAASVKTG